MQKERDRNIEIERKKYRKRMRKRKKERRATKLLVVRIFVLLPFRSFIRQLDKRARGSNRLNAQTEQSKKLQRGEFVCKNVSPSLLRLQKMKKSEIKKFFFSFYRNENRNDFAMQKS